MKITRRFRYHLGAMGLGLVCAACQASTPSKELMTARDVYTKAQGSDAARVAPDTLEEAGQALKAAEAAHERSPRSKTERNYAYLSVRKSELAMANAREVAARQELAEAQQAQAAGPYVEELAQTRAALAAREQDLGEALAAIIISQVQLHQLRAQRAEEGQVVVSRAGVFFDTGGTELSEEAKRQLDIVASDLLANPEQETVIQGYSDSQGDAEQNLQLSQKRAEVVRDYLSSRGVPAEGLRAMGLGDRHPVASNDTPTGRASNRRVEIATAFSDASGRQPVRGTDEDTEGDPQTDEPETDAEDPEMEEWERESREPLPEGL